MRRDVAEQLLVAARSAPITLKKRAWRFPSRQSRGLSPYFRAL
jgi:hypothetical protein